MAISVQQVVESHIADKLQQQAVELWLGVYMESMRQNFDERESASRADYAVDRFRLKFHELAAE